MLISESTPLVFMHIPKTGGMSMFTAFCRYWGDRIADLYNVSCADASPAVAAVQNHKLCLYTGHFSFGLHQWFDRPVYYASVVREPVARLVSLYYFVLPLLQSMRPVMIRDSLTAEQALGRPEIPDYYRDFAGWLEHEQTPDAFFSCPSADLDNGMVRRFSGFGLRAGPCPQAALEEAKANVEQYFSVVGVLERYPDTLGLMEKKFELAGLPENRVNINERKSSHPKLSDQVLRRIADMNVLDSEFYEWVRRRLDEELARPSPPIKVPAGRREDAPGTVLWRAVGRSPLREAAMEVGGVPTSAQHRQLPLVRQYLA